MNHLRDIQTIMINLPQLREMITLNEVIQLIT